MSRHDGRCGARALPGAHPARRAAKRRGRRCRRWCHGSSRWSARPGDARRRRTPARRARQGEDVRDSTYRATGESKRAWAPCRPGGVRPAAQRRSARLSLGEDLQRLELVLLEPEQVAETAVVDLDGVLVAEVAAHYRLGALRAGDEVHAAAAAAWTSSPCLLYTSPSP